MAYDLENRKWMNANKKCMTSIKNTIELAIVSSITECDSTTEYSLCSKIIAHLEFKICSTKECHFDPTIIKDKSFRRLFIKEIRHYLDPSHKRQGVF